MRKEATLRQWKELYDIGLEIKKIKPWEMLWDSDLIAIEDEGSPSKGRDAMRNFRIQAGIAEKSGKKKASEIALEREIPQGKDYGKILEFPKASSKTPKDFEKEGEPSRSNQGEGLSIPDREKNPPILGAMEDEDIFFASTMGAKGTFFGIHFYQGGEGLAYFEGLREHGDDFLYFIRSFSENNYLGLQLGNRENVPPEQYKIIKELGLKFRGKNQWLYFEAKRKYFLPWIPDQKEVLTLTRLLKHYKEVMEGLGGKEIDEVFGEGFLLFQRKKAGSTKREVLPAKSAVSCIVHMPVTLRDRGRIQQWKSQPKTKVKLEVDVLYTGKGINDGEHEAPIEMRVAILADSRSGAILKLKILPPEEEVVFIAQMIDEFIFDTGRPAEIHVCNPRYETALLWICKELGIKLKREDSLPAAWAFLDGLEGFFR